jgi:uncharacterized RDD family membrane protein YckC
MTPRAALVRNAVKVVPIFLVHDTLLMFLVQPERKQRISDRVAETLVVRA